MKVLYWAGVTGVFVSIVFVAQPFHIVQALGILLASISLVAAILPSVMERVKRSGSS
jgi:hypothetical protein